MGAKINNFGLKKDKFVLILKSIGNDFGIT